jgi:hypothetical protein
VVQAGLADQHAELLMARHPRRLRSCHRCIRQPVVG